MKKQITEAFERASTDDYILCCSCHKMDKKATEAFSVLYPDKPVPQVIKGRDRVHQFAHVHNNDHLKAISKLSGKYAYYIKLLGDDIVEEVDLVKGTKLR